MKNKIIYLFLIFLIIAISLSPRFSFGFIPTTQRSIDIRVEDIIIFVGLIAWFFCVLISGKYKFKLPPLFWPIFSMLAFGFFSILVNILLGKISLEITFFYFLKEIEFFLLYFIVFYCIASFNSNKQLIKYWLFFSLINFFWLVYVFIYNIKWSIWYGPNAFMEPQGPFPSGGYFLLIFIFSFNLLIFYFSKIEISIYKKVFMFILCIIPILGILSSGSMASTLGLFSSIFISIFLLYKDRLNLIVVFKILILVVAIFSILFSAIYILPVAKKIVSFEKIKWEYMSGSSGSRGENFINNLIIVLEHPQKLIIGIGIFGEAHCQYMRVLLERGVIGLLLFFWLMWSILKISYEGFNERNNNFNKGLFGGLFTATIVMLIMAIPNDVFMVVKVAEVYWFFVAMTTATILLPKENNIEA